MSAERIKDAVSALSLANLCYLRVWSELLTYSSADEYHMKSGPTATDLVAVMLNVLVTGTLIWAAIYLIKERTSRAGFLFGTAFVTVCGMGGANGLRAILSNRASLSWFGGPLIARFGTDLVLGIGIVLALCIAVAVFLRGRWMLKVSLVAARIVAPLIVILYCQALWGIWHTNPDHFRDKELAGLIQGGTTYDGPRVLWVVFDGLDYRLSFEERNANVDLPELDRLSTQSVFAREAFSPSRATTVSLPSLLTGERIELARPDAVDLLLVRLKGASTPVSLSTMPNAFSRLREHGVNSAMAGWFHPYCRLLNGDLAKCGWVPMAQQYNSRLGESLGEVMVSQARSLFETSLLSLFGQSLASKHAAQNYEKLMGFAQEFIADRNMQFILLHMSVPHSPYMYDSSRNDFSRANSPVQGYLDALLLADRALGQLRRWLEESGGWDDAVVIVSSDHSYRESRAFDGKYDVRVPFLIKMPGQQERVNYEPEFQTRLTQELIIAISRGEVTTPAEVVGWMDRKSAVTSDTEEPRDASARHK